MMNRLIVFLMILTFLVVACGSEPEAVPASPVTKQPTATATATVVVATETAVLPTPTAPATEEVSLPESMPDTIGFQAEIEETFTLFDEVPVVAHQDNGRYVNAGAVIFHEGQYHMLNNEFSTWPASTRTYYYTSPDGERWTRQSDEPVFESGQVAFTDKAALILTGFVEDDGTWVVYFHTFSSNQDQGFIGRATAANPLGPWLVDSEPVLSPGSEGEWDALHVMRANVLKVDDGYVMIYAGTMDAAHSQIGYATSPDGLVWTKYDDPTTVEAPYAESDPILQPEAEWERIWLGRPEVVKTEAGWVMLYEGGGNSKRGIAISQDGREWVRYENNPIFTQANSVDNDTFFQGELHFHEGMFRYYLEVGPGSRDTDVYLWTFPSPIANGGTTLEVLE